jgi:hypothetical protein
MSKKNFILSEAKKQKPQVKKTHPTLGLVTHVVEWPGDWWVGAQALAQAQDVNVISFFTGIDWENDMRCILHRLVSPEHLDGVGWRNGGLRVRILRPHTSSITAHCRS